MSIGQKLVQGLKRFAQRLERGEPIKATKVVRRSEQVVVRFTQGSYRPPRIVDNPED